MTKKSKAPVEKTIRPKKFANFFGQEKLKKNLKMFDTYPKPGSPLNEDHISFLKTFTKACRHSILKMVIS